MGLNPFLVGFVEVFPSGFDALFHGLSGAPLLFGAEELRETAPECGSNAKVGQRFKRSAVAVDDGPVAIDFEDAFRRGI